MAERSLEKDFGRYLQSVDERDIDLLLMEEFHVTPEFSRWFAKAVELEADAEFDGAWHSLNNHHGETDLLLRVRVGGERVAILIENKIGAPEQDEQDLRYHLRGESDREAGRFERFVTAICAPQIYLDGLAKNSAYGHQVPYEKIRDWFARQSGARAEWRLAIMIEAIEQGRRGYVMKVHAGKTAFQAAYWEYINALYPQFSMAKPGNKGPKSDWIIFKGTDFPKGVKLVHKNDQGCVDLEFERTSKVELARHRTDEWPQDIRVMARQKSAALSLPAPYCDMNRPLSEQIEKVEAVMEAARRLAEFAELANQLRR